MHSAVDLLSDTILHTINLGGEIITDVPSECLEFIFRKEDGVDCDVGTHPNGGNANWIEGDDGHCFDCGGNSSEELSSSDNDLPESPPLRIGRKEKAPKEPGI